MIVQTTRILCVVIRATLTFDILSVAARDQQCADSDVHAADAAFLHYPVRCGARVQLLSFTNAGDRPQVRKSIDIGLFCV